MVKDKIKLFSAFSGYGGDSFSLTKAKIPHRIIGYSEIDKYACKCFKQNHGDVPAYGDITKINWEEVPDFDLLTGGFPCGDISQAGEQDLSKGRSTLVFELIKALEVKQPKWFLFENVAAIQQEKFRSFLSLAENGMKNAGYKVYRRSLNTRKFGVPQNRDRVWFIGYRKDIAPQFGFTPYPVETGCTLRLLDVCDEKVDEKYYLSKKAVKRLVNNFKGYHSKVNPDIASTLFASQHKIARGMDLITSPIELTKNLSQAERVYDSKGLAITLSSQGGGMGAKTGLYLFGEIKQKIIKRKFETPAEINVFLKNYKKDFTNKDIADALSLPLTQVEHYFRVDSSRAIPSKENWLKLEELLMFPDVHDSLVTEMIEKENEFEMNQRVYSSEDIARTLTNSKETGLYAFPNATKQGYAIAKEGDGVRLQHMDSKTARGRVISQTSHTLQTSGLQGVIQHNRIRRLTPKECFRLMGFQDNEINLDGISDTQKYHLAGNGWDINLVSKIFESMKMEKE